MPEADGSHRMRADARRNRALVLRVAAEAFATDGLSVPVHEIARRAGVGTGTVSRHFPTKDALIEAIVADRLEWLAEQATALAAAHDPGEAFFGYLDLLVTEGSANRGLIEALTGRELELEATFTRVMGDLVDGLRTLVTAAQAAGAVRADVDVADVKALMAGCLTREGDKVDPDARRRMLAIVRAGLRPD